MQWLLKGTIAQLQSIARSIGSNTGGKKDVLRSHVLENLQQDRFILSNGSKKSCPDHHRIVSIDMGIRNLAMCTVVIPNNWTSGQPRTLPVVEDWERIAISKRSPAETSSDDAVKSTSKEAFDPQTFAQHAYDLVTKYILPKKPTQILIERQRFRSMGGSAVQEWTLRVNMFEAMIYATLKSFSELKLWHGSVYPVAPSKVSKFWLGNDNDQSEKLSTTKGSKTKMAKIAVVGDWLSARQRFEVQGAAADIARAYRAKLDGRARKAKINQATVAEGDHVHLDVGKLDDLADCMLQAMAWIQWEENRKAYLSSQDIDLNISTDDHREMRGSRMPK